MAIQRQAAPLLPGNKRPQTLHHALVIHAVQSQPGVPRGSHHRFFHCEMGQRNMRQLAQKQTGLVAILVSERLGLKFLDDF